MTEFKFGDEVRDLFNKRRGIVVNGKLLSMTSELFTLVDEAGARWATKGQHLVKLAPAGRPGIGAVVAMVAAARMVASGWGDAVPPRPRRAHWDWIPSRISLDRAPACGRMSSDEYAVTDIEFVDCEACLRMHARVNKKKVNNV